MEEAYSVLCGDNQFVLVRYNITDNVRGQCAQIARFHPVDGETVRAQVEFV